MCIYVAVIVVIHISTCAWKYLYVHVGTLCTYMYLFVCVHRCVYVKPVTCALTVWPVFHYISTGNLESCVKYECIYLKFHEIYCFQHEKEITKTHIFM